LTRALHPLAPKRLRVSKVQLFMMNGQLKEDEDGDGFQRVGLFGSKERWRWVAGEGRHAVYELQRED
jgi:hypothetical protein